MKISSLKLFLLKLTVITFWCFILKRIHITTIIIAFLYMFVQMPKKLERKRHIPVILESFLLLVLGLIIYYSVSFTYTTLRTRYKENKGNNIAGEINKIIDKSEEQILYDENCYVDPNIKLNKNGKPGMIFIDYDGKEISYLECGYEIRSFKLSNDDSCYSEMPVFRSYLSSPGEQITMYRTSSNWINKIEIKMKDSSTLYCCDRSIISTYSKYFDDRTKENDELEL